MEQIAFVQGKWLSTKSVEDRVVSWHFEASLQTGIKMSKYINKPFTIKVKHNAREYSLNANINQEIRKPISLDEVSSIIKIDIFFEHEEFIWDIILWELSINLWEKWSKK